MSLLRRIPRKTAVAVVAALAVLASTAFVALSSGSSAKPTPIEGYATYIKVGTRCDKAAKPGTLKLRSYLLKTYPGTTGKGISGNCRGVLGGHDEGRSFDWGVSVSNPAQKKMGMDFINRVLRTNSAGQKHAMARRMGIMRIAWGNKMFRSDMPERGWQDHPGHAHGDFMHITLDWPGARAQTSFYKPKPKPKPPTSNASFLITTWNVLGTSHTAPGGKLSSWPSGASRMVRAMDVIRKSKWDVVGLQEFQRSQREAFVRSVKKRKDYGIFPRTAVYKNHYSENSVIWKTSRFKFIKGYKVDNVKYFDGHKLWIPDVVLQDRKTKKFIRVINTHDPADTARYKGQERFRLFNAGKHAARARAILKNTNHSVFYTGDFNSAFKLRSADNQFRGNRAKLTYCVMTKSGHLRNALDVVRKRGLGCPTRKNWAIDHVYVSRNVSVLSWRQVGGFSAKRMSDHAATIARVRVN